MLYRAFVLLSSALFLFSYTTTGQVSGTHTELFIPLLELEPTRPIAGQLVSITTTITNSGTMERTNVTVSFNLDGVWIIDDLHVDVPARKSARVTFTTFMPVNPGEHQLRACPERTSLGEEGHHCQSLNFVAIDESTVAVAILSPREESVLSGTANIKVAALGQEAEKVELYFENELIATKNSAPYDFTIDTTRFADGEYGLYAIAYYPEGYSRVSSIKKYFIENGSGNVVVTVRPDELQRTEAKVGQSVIIESDVTNGQSFKIAATLIVLVKDANGYTEFLSWKEESIPIGETYPLARTWTPEREGSYEVEVFLWDTIENAVPLSDVMRAGIVVN